MNKDAKKLARIIEEDGWVLVRGGKSGHKNYKHPIKPGRVTIPMKNIKRNIILSVLRQAGINGSYTDFKNYKFKKQT